MEGWLIILGIALLRGVGAWYRRRQKKQQQTELPGTGQRRPEPGDPDAFDVEEFEQQEEQWLPSWESQRRQEPEPAAQAPSEPYGAPSWQTDAPADGPVFTEEDRKRQEVLRRLAQAAGDMADASRSLELPVGPSSARKHPHAGRGARISHMADRANSLSDALRSRRHIRQALLFREVLGPPVALRGPLRSAGSQPR